MTDESSNIHKAINKVMEEVGYVKKNKSPNLNYTFAGEAALISALRPAMVEQGIYMHVLEVKDIRIGSYNTKSGTAMTNTVVSAMVRFTHAPSGTFVDVAAVGEGSDAGDKSANKAMTGLYKYALRQTFCIETGDDPDKHQPEGKAGTEEKSGLITTAKIVSLKLADNVPNATKLIGLLKIAGWEEAAALNKIAIYRKWRKEGKLEPAEAAEKTNNGEVYSQEQAGQ
jgi:hypothetical protein